MPNIFAAAVRGQKWLWWREFIAEFVGTCILVGVGNGAVASFTLKQKDGGQVDVLANCLAFGVGAMVATLATAQISGAHLNPAVTVAMASLRKISWKKIFHYMIAQYLGAFMASAIVYVTYYDAINKYDGGVRSAYGNDNSTGGIFATYPFGDLTVLGALIDQIVGTAFLLFAVLAVGDKKGANLPDFLQPIVMALVITGVCVAYTLNCGAILNPARDLSPRIFTAIAGWGTQSFEPLNYQYWWAAGIVGPHLGGIIGAWIYYITIERQREDHIDLDESFSSNSDIPQHNVETFWEKAARSKSM